MHQQPPNSKKGQNRPTLIYIYIYIYKRADKILNCGKVDGARQKLMVLLNCPNLSAPWHRIE